MGPLVLPVSACEDIATKILPVTKQGRFGREHSEALPSIYAEELREHTLRGGARAHGNVTGKHAERGGAVPFRVLNASRGPRAGEQLPLVETACVALWSVWSEFHPNTDMWTSGS